MDKKMCKNCSYGVVRAKADETAPKVVCMKRTDFSKGKIFMTAEDYKCRNWEDGGEEDD